MPDTADTGAGRTGRQAWRGGGPNRSASVPAGPLSGRRGVVRSSTDGEEDGDGAGGPAGMAALA